jgi:flavodoxin
MKVVVVFYSYDRNCTFVAERLKSQLNADLIQIQMKDDKRRRGFAKFFWGGGMVFMKKKPPLKPYAFDPAAYDLIVIGAPVWAGSPAPPLKTLLSDTAMSGKKVALFVCHGGGKGNALGKFKAMLGGNEIVAEADFKEPLKNSEEAERRISDWVKQINA